MKKSLMFSILFFAFISVSGQNSSLYNEITQAKNANIFFENVILPKVSADINALSFFKNPDEVSFFGNIALDVNKSEIKALNVTLPIKHKTMILELVEVPDYFYNYIVTTENGMQKPANRAIKHFHGMVKDDFNSIVAITFYKDEMMGLVCTNEGNFNIALNIQSGKHLFYNEENLKEKAESFCATEFDTSIVSDPGILQRQEAVLIGEEKIIRGTAINKLIKFDVETRVNIYRRLGRDLDAVEAWVMAIFNQVALLYLNDDIRTCVSRICMWTGGDPYSTSDVGKLLAQFQNEKTSIDGDLGILLSFKGSYDGLASTLSGLCNSSTRNKLAVANIKEDYNIVPVYSQSVKVITHELGHLMGSPHTHTCYWNGDNTPIDGCGDPAGDPYYYSGCIRPPVTNEKGTIMSYCNHNGMPGIDFNLGFGPQPGELIRRNVIFANCLECIGPLNVTNHIITNYQSLYGCDTIVFQNVTISNYPYVDVKAGKTVIIASDFHVAYGTQVRIRIDEQGNKASNSQFEDSKVTIEEANLQSLASTNTDFTNSNQMFNLYPNPNNGTFQLETNFHLSEISNLKITDLLGVPIYENQSLTSNTIQLHAAATGTFFLIMVLKNGMMVTRKMVIQK